MATTTGLGQPKPEVKNFIQVSHKNVRNQSTQTIIFWVPGALAGSCTGSRTYILIGTSIWEVKIPRSSLAYPATCPPLSPAFVSVLMVS